MEVKIEKQVEDVINEHGLQEKKETGEVGGHVRSLTTFWIYILPFYFQSTY